MIQHTPSDRMKAMEVRWVISLTVLRRDEVSVDIILSSILILKVNSDEVSCERATRARNMAVHTASELHFLTLHTAPLSRSAFGMVI